MKYTNQYISRHAKCEQQMARSHDRCKPDTDKYARHDRMADVFIQRDGFERQACIFFTN